MRKSRAHEAPLEASKLASTNGSQERGELRCAIPKHVIHTERRRDPYGRLSARVIARILKRRNDGQQFHVKKNEKGARRCGSCQDRSDEWLPMSYHYLEIDWSIAQLNGD